jgi:hypothetical protein
MSLADVEFVMIGGCVQLASEVVLERMPPMATHGMELLCVDGVVRSLRAPVKELLERAEHVLGVGQVRLGGKPVCVPEPMEARHVS